MTGLDSDLKIKPKVNSVSQSLTKYQCVSKSHTLNSHRCSGSRGITNIPLASKQNILIGYLTGSKSTNRGNTCIYTKVLQTDLQSNHSDPNSSPILLSLQTDEPLIQEVKLWTSPYSLPLQGRTTDPNIRVYTSAPHLRSCRSPQLQ
jgi:hypothetical protein